MDKKQNWYTNPKKFHFIYKTTCLVNGKYYFGMHSTDDLADGYIGSGTYLAHSIRAHGRENFSFEILEFLADRESLRQREAELINEETLKDPLCMNLTLCGCLSGPRTQDNVGFAGKHHDENSRKQISDTLKQHWSENRDRMVDAQRGHAKSPETKKKIADANKGKVLNDEHRKKIAAAVKAAHLKRKLESESKGDHV